MILCGAFLRPKSRFKKPQTATRRRFPRICAGIISPLKASGFIFALQVFRYVTVPVVEASINSPAADAPLTPATELAGLEPIEKIKRRWPTVLGAGLTLLMIVGLVRELLGEGLTALWHTVPANPLFYLAFALFYLVSPTFDYFIFRRLWRIPLAGMVALHKKRISNDVLLGYSGEAYFYAWARQRTKMVAAPFGAIKDVTILSAIAGHAITLAMAAIALPVGVGLLTPAQLKTLLISVAVIVAMTLPFLIFSKRVFSLPKKTLWWIFGMHCTRIVAGMVFSAFAWHFAMPNESVGIWLLLCTGRQFVSRLPFLPNKDLVFANFAIMLIGQGQALSELMAFTAALTLLIHILLIAAFSVHSLLNRNRQPALAEAQA